MSVLTKLFLLSIYKGYTVFAFSVTMSVCKLFFSVKDFSATTLLRILEFGTKLDNDDLFEVCPLSLLYNTYGHFLSEFSQQLLDLGL